MSTPLHFDAIVVGSGAAGGWAAKELCERGLRTLLLEAGRTLDPVRDFPPPPEKDTSKLQVWTRGRAFLDGQGMQARCMSFSRMTRHLFVNDREHPYTTERGAPFNWSCVVVPGIAHDNAGMARSALRVVLSGGRSNLRFINPHTTGCRP